jgi:signal transduction histidine kinase
MSLRTDAESLDIALESINLVYIVEDACEMARKLASRRAITVNLVVGAQERIAVLGHTPSLKRMLWILLDNAMKYTPESGRIEVSLGENKGAPIIEVTDTGIGIAEADLPHIFERFYRANPSRSEVEGSGLGLAIAKWTVDIHHAQIHVNSCEGVGSSFTFKFRARLDAHPLPR